MPRSRFFTAIAAVMFIVAPAVTFAQDEDRDLTPKGESLRAKASKKEKKPKWDVNAPVGPSVTAKIDVDEGTWMSVDVHPGGEEIVFDLLGDIYTLPIAGGEATRIASGMAWDMQPRYSPDGDWLAFTSDEGGGDNIWIMRRDGSDRKAVSDEDFRLINSPVWTPDGEFIAGHKHFSSERSLGTGEIWLFHRSGGKGLQMTKQSNKQKDLGEPAFSPDGRYLYFSEDASPGKHFQYNKNPHGRIYVIHRMDREDGRIETFVDETGGSVRPTPSPDGKTLALVRRVGLKTALILRDIESGAERQIYDGLDRDMQETWAIHGVYPAMAWTPDNRSIVLWAGGKIRRVDADSGVANVIPFHVADDRRMLEALRFPIEVHPASFKTKMLRWVTVSPRGDSVVYQTLGRIYMRPLPDGEPRRLTSDDVVELYPSFSRDGSEIVYTTWSDDEMGTVRIAGLDGANRVISQRPGHYSQPAFSPDGESVVFRRTGSHITRKQLWDRETGIYVVPTTGAGAERLVSRSGRNPHFAAASARFYYVETDRADDKRVMVLKSIGIDETDRREHMKSEWATDFRVSPNGEWVAFRERFNAYITPFPPTGRTVTVGTKSKAMPLAKVSRDAGEYLGWSGDGERLHWSLGPELFTRELGDAFAFLAGEGAGAGAEPSDPPETGLDIGFEQKSDTPEGKLALVGARVITMHGDEVIRRGTVLIDRNRIVAVGATGEVTVPSDAHVIDVAGKTIMPGIVDVHYHGTQGGGGIVPEQNWSLLAGLTFGVTTAHDPSHDTATFFAASELVRAGKLTGPRLFSTGTILYGAKGSFKAIIDSLDDARSHLRRMKAVGAFSVKSYNQPRRNQRQQVIQAARELEMMVVPEGGSLWNHNMTMVIDGHTGVEHALPIGDGYDDMVQLWSQSGTGYTPTMGVGYGGLSGELFWYQESDVFAHARLTKFVPPGFLERYRRRQTASDGDWNHIRVARLAKKMTDGGIRVNLGAHGQREGLAAHWELWMFAQGGMTPLEAIRASTLNGAMYVGLDGDIGSIEVGKLADLMVIDGNPLEDIRVTEKVVYTVLNGRIYDAPTMNEIGNHPKTRAPFYWEN